MLQSILELRYVTDLFIYVFLIMYLRSFLRVLFNEVIISHRTVKLSMNDELERIWKEWQ
jgi:hypothetical protein